MQRTFWETPTVVEVSCGEAKNSAVKSMRNGAAGQYLVVADLLIREIETVIWDGEDIDVLVSVFGRFRGIQVKSSTTMSFGPGGAAARGCKTERKPLSGYKVDGFAFAYLPRRLVYYVTASAVQSRSMAINSFSLQACNMSFEEMIRRWEDQE